MLKVSEEVRTIYKWLGSMDLNITQVALNLGEREWGKRECPCE